MIGYLISRPMSFPKASIMRPKSRMNPTIWAPMRNLSPGFLLVSISYRVKTIWPPSRAGIGSRFMTPSIIEKRAVMLSRAYQSQYDGNIWPMAMKLPTDL